MSCSVFKEFPESNDNHVVVVINKNGNVSVDQADLHDFLVNDSTQSNTTVSVVRLRSPTSSIEEELNEQEELEKEMVWGRKVSDDELGECEEKDEIPKIPNLSVVVEKYYNADEAKQLASEILSAAGITNPLQVVIDLDYQRLAVSNDHCYTPFTSPSQRKNDLRRNTTVQMNKKLDVAKAKSKPPLPKVQPRKAEASEEDEEEVSDEDVDETDSENTFYSPSENENDRDSDLDFNVNDRPSRVRKFNRSKNSRNKRVVSVTKLTKKRASVGEDDKTDEPLTSSGKKKPSKRKSLSINKTTTPTTTPSPGVSILKATPVTSKGTSLVKVSTKFEVNVEIKKDTSSPKSSLSSSILTIPVPALTPISNSKIVQLQSKKDRKPPVHVDSYINNMSSLFSTPDIIRKVGTEPRSTPNTNIQTSITASNKGYFMPLTPSSIKNPQQLPAQISVRTHTTIPDLESEQDKQLELIDSFVQEELKQNTPPNIPNIVKIVENPQNAMINDVMNISSTQSTTNIPFANPAINSETLLDDSDILSGLGHAEDCLPEDLLQHVAKLVEDKKIQEVIDKQVLEENVTNSTMPSVISTPSARIVSKFNAIQNASPRVDATKPDKTLDRSSDKILQSTTTPVAAKEPIKIVRSDGRVILLPPLEAPTTRAKRRALTLTDSVAKNEPVVTTTPKSSKPIPKVDDIKEKARRSSITKKITVEQKEQKVKAQVPTATVDPFDEDYDDEDSDGSYNAEDDPYRLWCICRQPHNNRFMICCDKCEDWFHGKCVNVTKAMGTEMEEQGIEWVCPNCIKKQSGKKPAERKSSVQKGSLLSCIVCKNQARPNSIYCSDDCIRKHAQSTSTNVSSSQNDSPSTTEKSKKMAPLVQSKLPSHPEYTITKSNRVIVFESSSGRVLTGNTAPTPDTLKQWLQDNPTFEVIKPGSKQELFIREKQEQINRERQRKQNATTEKPKQQTNVPQQKIQTTLKVGPSKNLMFVNPTKKTAQQTPPPSRPITKVQKNPTQVSPKPSSPVKQSLVTTKCAAKPSTPKIPAPRTSNQNKRKSDSKSESKPTESKNEPSSETTRITVHRFLKEAISQRMSEVTESKHPKLTAEEIDKFASDTEREIYHLFSKDIGAKYRAKYRSLVFNIKDRKNDSLFQKICEKTIQPNQFVRMTAEELASQQLAQWRENENKHQLEMIKKSELDLLACAKNYVLKTHKGEEVIESKISDRVTLDPSVSVEDVVSVLNNSTVSSTSENVDLLSPIKDQRIDTRFDKYLSVDSSGISGTKLGSSSSSTSKKKDGRRSRSKSRDRIQDKHESRKSSSNKHKRKRSRERRSKSRDKRSKSGEKDKNVDDKSRDKDRERDVKKKDDKDKRDREKQQKTVDSKEEYKTLVANKLMEPPKPVKKEGNFNLIDKILEAQSTIDRVLRAEDTKKEGVKSASKISQPIAESMVEQKHKVPPSSECDQEPSSTVTIPTPPEYLFNKQLIDEETTLWSGTITMIDIATFQISIHAVNGDCDSIRNELPTELDVVGRIIPDTVWEYIEKIKKTKEILIIRLSAATEDDNDAYCELYKYLYSKKRLGVIKTTSRSLKDFYIFPLAAHKSLPSVLQSIDGQGFENGRPDLLLGIIVKTTVVPQKRVISTQIAPITNKVSRMTDASLLKPRVANIIEEDRYTPPSSPKTKSHGLEKTIDEVLEDGDEPYSPGGSDDEIPFQTSINISTPAAIQPSALYAQMEQDEIQRKMDELNRQIEAQKMEIAGMLHSDTVADEPYSPTSSMSTSTKSAIPALANISIPSNLQEILNSIKQVSSGQTADQSIHAKSTVVATPIIHDDDEYTPTSVDSEYNLSADYVPTKTSCLKNVQSSSSIDGMQLTSKEPSKLAQLTEEELLSMVPDDIELPPVTSFKKQSNEPSTTKMSKYEICEEEEYVP